jgi:hypothetical protein
MLKKWMKNTEQRSNWRQATRQKNGNGNKRDPGKIENKVGMWYIWMTGAIQRRQTSAINTGSGNDNEQEKEQEDDIF